MAVKEFSYTVVPRIIDQFVDELLDKREALLEQPNSLRSWKRVSLNTPDVSVLYKYVPKDRHTYLVFADKSCKADVSFVPVSTYTNTRLQSVFGKDGFVPHSLTRKDFRGLGYVSFFYKLVLQKYVLSTSSHTTDARAVWDSLVAKSGIYSYWVDPITLEVFDKPNSRVLRVLSTTPIKEKA